METYSKMVDISGYIHVLLTTYLEFSVQYLEVFLYKHPVACLGETLCCGLMQVYLHPSLFFLQPLLRLQRPYIEPCFKLKSAKHRVL